MNILIQLLSDILNDVITGQVESASNRLTHKVWWRYIIYFIILGAALWVAFSSAFLWTSGAHRGVVGLIDYVEQGGPVWMLGIPLLAILIVIVGSLPVAGRYGPVFILQCGLFALVLAGMASFQGDGRSALNMAALSSFLVLLPATLLAIVTALADAPPVTSPLAIFSLVFIGRLGHLRRLLANAQRLGWEFSGPTGADRVFTAEGSYEGRRVRVLSGISFQGETSADRGYWLKVTVTSPSPLPTFEITRQKIPSYVASRAITGKVGGGLIPPRFYVIPSYDHSISDEWRLRFARQTAIGRAFLRSLRSGVQLTSGGILYTQFRNLRLTRRSGDIQPLVDWLIGIATLLEEIAPSIAEVAPTATDDITPRLPYGQISDVGPTSPTW
jgi:hypothetical protein